MNLYLLKKSFILILSFTITYTICGQEKYYTKSKKAVKNFESALNQYNLRYFDVAKAYIEESLKIDNNFIDAYILLGEIANEEDDKEKAIAYYKKAISIKDDFKPLAYLRLAEIQKSIGKYSEAKSDFQKFMEFKKYEKEYGEYASEKIKQCDFAMELMKHPVSFHPKNLGPQVNTSISEYWPSLTADDSILVFTSSNRQTNSQEDLYFSIKDKDGWRKALKMPPPVNSEGSEGAQTISADGRTMVFTACLRKDGYGSCDLYISKKQGKYWSKPVNMGNTINTQYKETQPSLSADGKTIYFVSNRIGGKGKFDIWKSVQKYDGTWETPENMGDSINTKEDELAPFIHYDGRTLYFSSEGHLGMGGSDLFFSKIDKSGNWSFAKNVGYPINTYFNEESLVITADAKFGLFSSNMKGGFGQKDIYQFEIPPGIKPDRTIYIKGLVYDSNTKKPLRAEINVSSLGNNLNLITESDDDQGEFLVCLMPGDNYAFNVNKQGYLIFSENIFLSDTNMYIKIPLTPIEIGLSVVLKNIFFEFNSYELKAESFAELKKLINFLESNKTTIEIQGHTDNAGTLAYNQKLSENRAKSVYDYLINNGIDKKYLRYKGYGYSKPIASNETEEGRAKNRRTAFEIISRN